MVLNVSSCVLPLWATYNAFRFHVENFGSGVTQGATSPRYFCHIPSSAHRRKALQGRDGTLCSLMILPDLVQAVACFRMAIRRDRRHYNAWYGLGSIYHRQEKYDMAEYHFRRALKINSQSRYLHERCCSMSPAVGGIFMEHDILFSCMGYEM